jgi:hypothetical protein
MFWTCSRTCSIGSFSSRAQSAILMPQPSTRACSLPVQLLGEEVERDCAD